jgi:hypothetical protein
MRIHWPPLYPQTLATSSNQDDIDPELLHKIQAYLDCRRLSPWRLIAAWDEFYVVYDPLIRRLAITCGARSVDLELQASAGL